MYHSVSGSLVKAITGMATNRVYAVRGINPILLNSFMGFV